MSSVTIRVCPRTAILRELVFLKSYEFMRQLKFQTETGRIYMWEIDAKQFNRTDVIPLIPKVVLAMHCNEEQSLPKRYFLRLSEGCEYILQLRFAHCDCLLSMLIAANNYERMAFHN